MAEAAQVASPMHGDALYQQRARCALPLLVRQAQAGTPIEYGALASELGMPNARNLDYVLGSIGKTLIALAEEWEEAVPPIQCLVINKTTRLPGKGVDWFLIQEEEFSALSRTAKRELVQAELAKVFTYPFWSDVLEALSLEPAATPYAPIIQAASRLGGGESEAHRLLKRFVARHPEVVGLPHGAAAGTEERRLPSGDQIDVSFERDREWLAVEVKPATADQADIARGLFQCVKYRAVMEAVQASNGQRRSARAVLVLGGTLPSLLVGLRNLLDIEVVEKIDPRRSI